MLEALLECCSRIGNFCSDRLTVRRSRRAHLTQLVQVCSISGQYWSQPVCEAMKKPWSLNIAIGNVFLQVDFTSRRLKRKMNLRKMPHGNCFRCIRKHDVFLCAGEGTQVTCFGCTLKNHKVLMLIPWYCRRGFCLTEHCKHKLAHVGVVTADMPFLLPSSN